MPEQALSDVKVLDLTCYIAGPYCTKLLADYGADVIKVERPGEGDPARRMGPFLGDEPHPERSALFSHLNTNKRGITLNLKSATGKKIFRQLAKGVDVLVESFSPGVMERLGLGYGELERVNPRLVMTSISNFGQDGPYRDFKTSELIINGLGHDMYNCGVPERSPVKIGSNCMQYQSGLITALATMGALWAREEQGLGQHLDISIMETQAGDVDRRTVNLLNWAYSGAVRFIREEYPSPVFRFVMPRGVYACKDGFLRVVPVLAHWPRFVELAKEEKPELKDFRFPEDVQDVEKWGEVEAFFASWCLARTMREAMLACQAAKFFGTAVQTPKDVVGEPQLGSRDYWTKIDHPESGEQTYPGAPIRMAETPWQVRRPAPLLGQHNAEVLGELGYSKDDLIKLREMGII